MRSHEELSQKLVQEVVHIFIGVILVIWKDVMYDCHAIEVRN